MKPAMPQLSLQDDDNPWRKGRIPGGASDAALLSMCPSAVQNRLSNGCPEPTARIDGVRVLQFQATVLSHAGFGEAATAFATELATALRCDRVSIGFLEHGYAKVVAVSHGTAFDARQKLLQHIAAAMDEAIEQGASLCAPQPAAAKAHILLAQEELRREHGGAVCSIPIVSFGRPVGAITLERTDAAFGADEVSRCEDVACLVGPVLELKRDCERPLRQRIAASLRGMPAALGAPGRGRARLILAAGLVALVLASLVPVTHRIGAPARLEGSMQRIIVAPIDGFLRQVHVRPGDRVKAGELLAELDEHELRIEQQKWGAELAQHDNAYGAALAHADRARLVINQAKAAAAQAQLALVEQQIERLRVQAPFDGIVIKGDLTQSLGAPLQRGETLLTLAPDSGFRLIIEVDERDIGDVRPGQAGRLALAAQPNDTLAFSVERVTPVAATAEGRNYFEVEARLDDSSPLLRPGLRGIAKIEAGDRPTAWILTHRVVDWLRYALWSLGA